MIGSEHIHSVRKFTTRDENITKFLGEIERNIYAAEIICQNDEQIQNTDCQTCPAFGLSFCKIKQIRKVIGERKW